MQNNQESIPLVAPEDYLKNLTEKERRPSGDTEIDQVTGERKTTPAASSVVDEKPKMDLAEAKSKTERMLKFRDFLQKWALAWLAGDVSKKDDFGMSQWEFAMLTDVYNDVVISMGYIPKWFDIMIAEVMIMGPKIAKVIGHRNLLAENKKQAAYIADLEKRSEHFASDKGYETPGGQSYRIDAKKWWEVDADGYFLYDKNGYVTKDRKHLKPDVNDPTQLEMIVKHNGGEKINRIFNLNI